MEGVTTMDRLTIRNGDGSVSQPTDLRWAEALDKLAAYEDTGLSPEEVGALFRRVKRDNVVIPDVTLFGKSLEHWDKLNKAEAEGRLVILPCKVGDTVYAVLEDMDSYGSYIIEDEQISEAGSKGFWVSGISDEPDEMHIFTPWSDFGKMVFLTREEAEKALEGRK